LEHAVSKAKLKELLEKEFDLKLEDKINQYIFANSSIEAENSCIFVNSTDINLNTIKDEIRNFVKKYGWYLRDILTDGTKLELDCPSLLKRNLKRRRLFIHASIAPPNIILRTGFRLRTYERIYLRKISKIPKPGPNEFIEGIPEDLDKQDFNNHWYHKYHFFYLIDLPKNIQVHIDPEFGDEDNAYFITEPIQAKYIKYLGYDFFED
jgi:hypothetical protein